MNLHSLPDFNWHLSSQFFLVKLDDIWGKLTKIQRDVQVLLKYARFCSRLAAEDTNVRFYSCMLEEMNLIEDSKIQSDMVEQGLSPLFGANKIKEVQDECDTLWGINKHYTAYSLAKCYMKILRPVYELP